MSHCYNDLILIFNQLFLNSENTELIKGGDDPIYLPASNLHPRHRLCFAHGFYASALHEISHWCIAGAKRRLKEDFGYWYLPDSRNAQQQADFEYLEIKPQAIEWAFSIVANKTFQVSVDNLDGVSGDRFAFQEKVRQQLIHYVEQGFPPRAQAFIDALIEFYQPGFVFSTERVF